MAPRVEKKLEEKKLAEEKKATVAEKAEGRQEAAEGWWICCRRQQQEEIQEERRHLQGLHLQGPQVSSQILILSEISHLGLLQSGSFNCQRIRCFNIEIVKQYPIGFEQYCSLCFS